MQDWSNLGQSRANWPHDQSTSTEHFFIAIMIMNDLHLLVYETLLGETETETLADFSIRAIRDRDEALGKSRDRLETETSRPKSHPCLTYNKMSVSIFVRRLFDE